MVENASLKSILKPSSSFPNPPDIPSTRSPSTKTPQNRALALQHAHIIRLRRETEDQIFASLCTLLAFPLSLSTISSRPSASDITAFKIHLRPFRPRDYDDLIIERNLDGKCGYVLCPNRKRRDESVKDGALRIVGRGEEVKVVKKEELERWCEEGDGSGDRDGCKRRALWVRVQLCETPAWEREGSGEDVELWGEAKETIDGEVRIPDRSAMRDLDGKAARGEEKLGEAALALERGDRGSRIKGGLVDVKIEEKVTGVATTPSLDEDQGVRLDTMHLALEGYTPSFGRGNGVGGEEHTTELSDYI